MEQDLDMQQHVMDINVLTIRNILSYGTQETAQHKLCSTKRQTQHLRITIVHIPGKKH